MLYCIICKIKILNICNSFCMKLIESGSLYSHCKFFNLLYRKSSRIYSLVLLKLDLLVINFPVLATPIRYSGIIIKTLDLNILVATHGEFYMTEPVQTRWFRWSVLLGNWDFVQSVEFLHLLSSPTKYILLWIYSRTKYKGTYNNIDWCFT